MHKHVYCDLLHAEGVIIYEQNYNMRNVDLTSLPIIFTYGISNNSSLMHA